MEDLQKRLTRWTEAGLLTAEQADRIAAHERARTSGADLHPAHRGPATDGSSRRVAVAEAVGYVGAALAVAALGLFVGELWPELRVGGQLALVGLLTALAAGAGQAVHGQGAPAMQRLTGVLWAAAALGGAWFAGIVAAEIVDLGDEHTAIAVGTVGAVIAVPLLLRRPSLPLQAASLGGLLTVAVATLSLADLRPDAFWYGLLVAAIGGAWLLLGHGGFVAPRRTAEVLGGVLALIGAQVGAFGDLQTAALGLGVLLAGALVALAVARDAGYHLVVGALGLFVLVPQVVFEVFGDAIGAPATLLVVGLLLVVLAVGLGRARKEVGDRGDQAQATDPTGGPR